MRCYVVFGVTLRLFVINISSSSPAINNAAYYQRCVITSDMVAVHRRPRLQHLLVAVLTQTVKPDIGSESRFLPTAISTPPLGGFPSEYCYAVWHGKPRMAWLLATRWWKNFEHVLLVLTWSTNVTDTRTDGRTDRHRPRLHSIARQKCGKMCGTLVFTTRLRYHCPLHIFVSRNCKIGTRGHVPQWLIAGDASA